MCVDVIDNEYKREQWLKKQPETVIAYKIVRKRKDGKYYPLFTHHRHGSDSFFPKRMNRIKGFRSPISARCLTNPPNSGIKCYTPEYHFFKYKNKAVLWGVGRYAVIVRCEIPKKDITEVGTQDGMKAIVASAFKIIEEVHQCITG